MTADRRAALVDRVLGCFPDDAPAENRHARIALDIIRAEVLEEAARVAEQQEEERIGVPCPDGIKGCAVFHFRRRMRPRNHLEIAAAIRALKEK